MAFIFVCKWRIFYFVWLPLLLLLLPHEHKKEFKLHDFFFASQLFFNPLKNIKLFNHLVIIFSSYMLHTWFPFFYLFLLFFLPLLLVYSSLFINYYFYHYCYSFFFYFVCAERRGTCFVVTKKNSCAFFMSIKERHGKKNHSANFFPFSLVSGRKNGEILSKSQKPTVLEIKVVLKILVIIMWLCQRLFTYFLKIWLETEWEAKVTNRKFFWY